MEEVFVVSAPVKAVRTESRSPALSVPSVGIAPAPPVAPKLDALTSLRFFAAAMIVMLHAQGYFGDIPALQQFVLTQGVCFFFVLSGFILTYAYPTLNRGSMARFLVGRCARIVPLHVVALVLFVVLIPAWHRAAVADTTPVAGLLSLFLLQAWVPDFRVQTAFNGVSWSLSAELFFYLCLPLLLWRWRQTWMLKLALVFALLCGMIVLANSGAEWLPLTTTARDLVYFHPLARLWEFTLGVATAHIWRYLRSRRPYGRESGTALEVLVIAGTLFVMASSLAWSQQLGQVAWIGPGGEAWLASSGWVCLPFAALILVIGLNRGRVAHLLAWRPLVRLGEISFALYLLEVLPLHLYVLHPEPFIAVPAWQLYLGYWGILLLSAYVGWAMIETPCRHAILAWWNQRAASAPKAAASRSPARRTAQSLLVRCANAVAVLTLVGVFAVLARLPESQPPASTMLVALSPTKGRASIGVDQIGTHPLVAGLPVILLRTDYPDETITVEGWAADTTEQTLARGVLVRIDDGDQVWARYGSTRNDVARYLEDSRYLRSGYIGALSLRGLSDGMHTITVRVLVQGTADYSETTQSVLVY